MKDAKDEPAFAIAVPYARASYVGRAYVGRAYGAKRWRVGLREPPKRVLLPLVAL